MLDLTLGQMLRAKLDGQAIYSLPEVPPAIMAKAYAEVQPDSYKQVYTAGYSCLGLAPMAYRKAVAQVAKDLPFILEECRADCVVVRGSSGTVFAGALLFAAPSVRIVVARKEGENSHGSQISAAGGDSFRVERYLILDDFVASGGTVRGIIADMNPAQCVGIVEYQYAQGVSGNIRYSGKPCGAERRPGPWEGKPRYCYDTY